MSIKKRKYRRISADSRKSTHVVTMTTWEHQHNYVQLHIESFR